MSNARLKPLVLNYINATLLRPASPAIRRAILKSAFKIIRRCGPARLVVYTLQLKAAG